MATRRADLVDSYEPLQLIPGRWYGWQMLPGYGSTPYFSPIRIESVTPMKTGRKVLEIRFFNAFYAQGVQHFTVYLRILKHTSEYLIAEFENDSSHPRSAVITPINFEWIHQFAPNVWDSNPPPVSTPGLSVDDYLNGVRW